MSSTVSILLLLCIILCITIYNRCEIYKLRKELKDFEDGLFVPHAKKDDKL